ncbi:MAG: hypothetical protein ACYTHJ_02165 [Planctomycetota bacterium]
MTTDANQPPVSSSDTACESSLAGNLSALRRFQPDVARRVESARLPDFRLDTGRDGTKTLRILDNNGSWVWFGGSSMPTVSADAIAGVRSRQSGNVVVPGVLTGRELLLIADNRPDYVAIFVVESDPAAINLAMRLYDYAPLINAGRLVWVVGQDPVADTCRFLEAHDGYELPWHIVRVPQCAPQQLDALQRNFERAGVTHAAYVERTQREIAERMSRQDRGGGPTASLAVVGIDPRDMPVERAGSVRRAAANLGWECALSIPESPDQVHTLARLRAVERAAPDWVLFLGVCPQKFRELLDPRTPVVSWSAMAGHTGATPRDERFAQDLWLAASQAEKRSCLEQRLAEAQLDVLDSGVDNTLYSPGDNITGAGPISVLMDVPNDSAEANEVVLSSQVTLWNSLQRVIASAADEYTYERADHYVTRAEEHSGVELAETTVRTHFIQLLRGVLAPAGIARAIVQSLLGTCDNISIWGNNWSGDDLPGHPWAGAIPSGEQRRDILRSSRAIVLGPFAGPAVELALQAAACGSLVIVRGARGEAEREFPHLAELLSALYFYTDRAELVQQVTTIQGMKADALIAARRAMRDAAEPHSIKNRLLHIAERVARLRLACAEG